MKEHEHTPPETVLCGRCAALCDPDDNFCRQCGLPFTEQHLPSVRNGHSLPAVWRPPVPAVVVKGAVFVALGTLAEAFLRRLARRALGGDRAAASTRPGNASVVAAADPADTDGQIMSETLLMRHIRVRR